MEVTLAVLRADEVQHTGPASGWLRLRKCYRTTMHTLLEITPGGYSVQSIPYTIENRLEINEP